MAGQPVLAYVGLGANLGDPSAALGHALQALESLPGTAVGRVSSLYRTAPIDADGPDFVNAVALLHTSLSPAELLAQLQHIETECGRERPYRNAPRTLDLDLLLYGTATLDSPGITVPHPRLHQRAFVLVPLAEVAGGNLEIPGRGTLQALLQQVADQSITRLADHP